MAETNTSHDLLKQETEKEIFLDPSPLPTDDNPEDQPQPEPEIETHFFGFEKSLIHVKLVYLFLYATSASLNPFLTVYYRSIHISEDIIGVLSAIRPWCAFVGAPLMGALADIFKIHKIVLLVGFFVFVVLYFCISLVGDNIWAIGVFLAVGSFASSSVGSIYDASVLEILGDRSELYGKQRLWGAVSWGIFSLAISGLVTLTDNIHFHFYGLVTCGVITWILLAKIKITPPKETVQFWKSIGIIVSSWDTFSFYIIVFIMGCAYGCIQATLFVFLRDELGANEILLGSSVTVTVSTEIIFFYFSDKIIKKLGEKNLIYVALLAYIARFLYYAILTNPWAVYPAELLHGLTFAAMWSSSVSYAKSIAPPGMGSTMQGLLSAAWQGIGCGTGNLVSGFLYRDIGASHLYFVMAGWCAFGLLFYIISNKVQDHLKSEKTNQENNTSNETDDTEPLVGGNYEGFPNGLTDEDNDDEF